MKDIEYYLGLNYHKTVTQDDEGDYIVEVQELPGCVADGREPNEAFESLKEAMKSWIASRLQAGLHVPEPTQEPEYSGKILVRMPKFLHRRLATQAISEGISLNQYVVSLLSDGSARVNQGQAEEVYSPQYLLPNAYRLLAENVRSYVRAGFGKNYGAVCSFAHASINPGSVLLDSCNRFATTNLLTSGNAAVEGQMEEFETAGYAGYSSGHRAALAKGNEA